MHWSMPRVARSSRQGGRELIDGSWTVPGLWRPDEVRDAFDAEVPDGSTYETMGGFVMTSLGRVPVVGDVVRLPGWRIHVVGMEGRRVDRLRFVPDPESLPHDGVGDDGGAGDGLERPGVDHLQGEGQGDALLVLGDVQADLGGVDVVVALGGL